MAMRVYCSGKIHFLAKENLEGINAFEMPNFILKEF